MEIDLPEGWVADDLGKIATRITKGATPTTYGFAFQKQGINFIKVENIKEGKIQTKLIKDFIGEDANAFQSKSRLEVNDILFSIAGTIGETCIVKNEYLPANTNQALAIIRGTADTIIPNLLSLQLNSFVNRIKSKARGGAMNNVSLEDLKNFKVIIPPISEQHQIIEKIEELFSELDKGIENLKIARQQLKVYRQAVLKWAFEGKIIDDNSKWQPFNLGNIINGFQNGLSKRNADEGVPFNVLRLADIKDGNIRSKDPRQIKLSVIEIDKYKVDNSDLLVIRVNGSKDLVGKFVLCNGHSVWAFCDHFIRVRPNVEMVDPVFIKYFTETQLTRKYIEDNIVSSAGQNTISQTTLSNIEISLPSVEIQKQIILEIESRMSVCDKMEETITNSLQQAEALRQSILKRAFEGKLINQKGVYNAV